MCLWISAINPASPDFCENIFSQSTCPLRGTANNSVLQPLNLLHNNILRIIAFSNSSCHVTPLYNDLNVCVVLKLNDICVEAKWYISAWIGKFMHKLRHGALPKIFDNFFKNISNFHSYKTRFADNQNCFMQRVCKNSGEKSISYRGAALWKEIEQSMKFLPYVTFCRHYKDRFLKYE